MYLWLLAFWHSFLLLLLLFFWYKGEDFSMLAMLMAFSVLLRIKHNKQAPRAAASLVGTTVFHRGTAVEAMDPATMRSFWAAPIWSGSLHKPQVPPNTQPGGAWLGCGKLGLYRWKFFQDSSQGIPSCPKLCHFCLSWAVLSGQGSRSKQIGFLSGLQKADDLKYKKKKNNTLKRCAFQPAKNGYVCHWDQAKPVF